ncbi:hypothetical protein JRO89_XS13G0029100 [Xanthoceras sorbifolium]|uniref:Histone deacetylase interacting domain-containing protein n=1 Tax=Xanthoceras sorbifolium TaxID=99658 RepID=A0ABQ8H668_9ROSI|nr:hypothetical protein JRO89_XS13G0029100 [Xanthoceras sorbifolium]
MKRQRTASFGYSESWMSQRMECNNGGFFGDTKSSKKVKFLEDKSVFVTESAKKTLLYKQGIEFCERVRERLNCSCDYQMGFLKYIHACTIGKIGESDLKRKISRGSISKYPDLTNGFDDFVKHCEDIAFADQLETINRNGEEDVRFLLHPLQSRTETITRKDSNPDVFDKTESDKVSIQDLDLSKCQAGTPSYRLLPEDFPVAMASQRSELGAQVLNDFWFDMLLNSIRSAAEHVEELVDGIKEKNINLDASFRIEDHLNVLNLRCIERLYDQQGHQMLEMLNKNPKLVLPLILSRLKQKVEEVAGRGSDSNRIWAQVYAANHRKSLEN